ncbi:MAG: Extradiol ring-cleavage dioxygenase, class enzyme subunit [Bryobacterales bacterium]|nr:Extradiol ring-cleavage dioxygenase, class enzyme subunit [Bryobacterales bacterium]
MARITFGLGTSHGPMLSIPPEYWQDRVSFDRENPRHFYQGKTYNFNQMVELHKNANLAEQITPEVSLERHTRCQNAIRQLADFFDQHRPDIAVVVGNDQMEIFTDQHVPAFAVFWGDHVEGHPRSPEFLAKLNPAVARAEADRTPPVHTDYPCSPELGKHVIESVIADGFDVSQLTKLPTVEIGSNAVPHAYGFVYRRIMRDKVPMQVPVFVNTFYPPNQPPAGRCFDFGRALARAITSWPGDTKVAFIASGGMTHFVLDESLDHELLDAMQAGDAAKLASVPENMFQAGTSEIKNWIVVAGVMAEAGLKMNLVDYVPCYRSEAGTGSAMGFARWC